MIGIELKKLSFSYAHENLFTNVDFKFLAGQKISIQGENGAGKTTLIKLLCSLLQPQSGNIHYTDSSNELAQDSLRKKLGVSLDESHLLRHFTVLENLRLYQKLYTGKVRSETILHWLERFHLQAYLDTPIQYLSQGEQKKVSIIKALMHEPEVLIFDEPTNSLDQESKEILSTIFQKLDSNHLLLVSTHDQAWSNLWANKEVKIARGQLS